MQALMIIDMQNDFVDPTGKAVVAQALDTVPTIQKLLNHWRSIGWPIVHVVRDHAVDGHDSELFRKNAPVCINQTWGAAHYPSLEPNEGEKVLVKKRFSAFFNTELEQWLHQQQLNEVVVTGTQLPNCVRGTAVDGQYRDLLMTVVSDACSAQSDAVAKANLYDLSQMGISVIDSHQALSQTKQHEHQL